MEGQAKLAPNIPCALFHPCSPDIPPGFKKNMNPFSFSKAEDRLGAPLLLPCEIVDLKHGSGLSGFWGQRSLPASTLHFPCRRRLRRCTVCIRTPRSPRTPWWPCQSSAPCVQAPVRTRGPSTWCCCSYRKRSGSPSWSRMGRRYRNAFLLPSLPETLSTVC